MVLTRMHFAEAEVTQQDFSWALQSCSLPTAHFMVSEVRGEATVGSRPREDRTISPPQKHTAIANVAHSEVIIA